METLDLCSRVRFYYVNVVNVVNVQSSSLSVKVGRVQKNGFGQRLPHVFHKIAPGATRLLDGENWIPRNCSGLGDRRALRCTAEDDGTQRRRHALLMDERN